jgi:hypothetical protein
MQVLSEEGFLRAVTKTVTTQKTVLTMRNSLAIWIMGGREGFFSPSVVYKNPGSRANTSFEGDFLGGDKNGDSFAAGDSLSAVRIGHDR